MTTTCEASNAPGWWSKQAREWRNLGAAALVLGLVPYGFATCHGSPSAPTPVAAAKSAVPEPQAAQTPASGGAPPQVSEAPPPGPWDQPAPPCVTQLIKQQVEKVGPGVAEVGCDGKHYRCVATLVRGQVAFNCAEMTPETPKAVPDTAAPSGGISL